MSCALCGLDKPLRESHLIPKLVYRRIKSHPNSRFRSLDDFSHVMQDGEKHKMLCHDCEEKFSALEVYFANNFLDPYLANEIIPSVTDQRKLDDYIMSVAWRILWDDLYRLGSFNGHHRREFEQFEIDLRDYLFNGTNQKAMQFENYIYRLSDLIICPASVAEGSLFGYAYYPNAVFGCLVLVYYAGLVFVTHYIPNRKCIFVLDGFKQDSFDIDIIVQEELIHEFSSLIKQYKVSMTPEIKAKLATRYKAYDDTSLQEAGNTNE